MKPACGNCVFGVPVKGYGGFPALECHRYPPIEVGVKDMVQSRFPSVRTDEWCGEHQTGSRP